MSMFYVRIYHRFAPMKIVGSLGPAESHEAAERLEDNENLDYSEFDATIVEIEDEFE